ADAAVGDRGILAEHVLDLAGADPEALVLDELLLTVDDEDVPALVLAADVAGVEPAVTDDVGGVLRLVPVPAHDLRPAHADLTDLTGREDFRPALEVDDPVLGPRDRGADRLEDRRGHGIGVRHRRGLGEAVALDDGLPEALRQAASRPTGTAEKNGCWFAVRFACVSITPLGKPVVPLVYGSAARSVMAVFTDTLPASAARSSRRSTPAGAKAPVTANARTPVRSPRTASTIEASDS